MTRRPPSLRRIALMLTLPVLLLAGMGVWVIVTEGGRVRAQVEAEWKPLARTKAKSLLAYLPYQISPEKSWPGYPMSMVLALSGLTRNLGAHVYSGNEPPPAAETWPLLVEIREAWQAGQEDSARDLLKRHASALEAEHLHPAGRRGYSPGGLPVRLIWAQLDVDTAEESEREWRARELCRQAVRNPCEASSRAIRSVLPLLPEEDREQWKVMAAETDDLLRLIAKRAAQRKVTGEGGLLQGEEAVGGGIFPERGEWVGDWLLRARDVRTLGVIPYAPWCQVMSGFLAEADLGEIGGHRIVAHLWWHGRSVTPDIPMTGSVLAEDVLGPWQATILTANSQAISDEIWNRRKTKGLIFGGLSAVAAIAMWLTYRAFKKQAELSRMQTEFVASVSHELRTPVAGIGALAERLESGTADAAQTAEYHRMIAREGRRLAALVDNVLDFSRMERGAKAYDLDHADLPRLITETAALMRPMAEEKGLSLNVELEGIPESQWPPVDAGAMRQALLNLLDNAIKFTPSGGTVTVGMRIGDAARREDVCVFVRDTGIGIPAAEQARIFEKFYRVDNGLRRETTGAGIGLSIVKHIAEAHGARVSVVSAGAGEEKFSVFSIQFSMVRQGVVPEAEN